MNTLTSGLKDKQLGLYRVESHNAALVKLARAIAKEICGRVGSVTIDQVRSDSRMAEFQPSSSAVWGTVFQGDEWKVVNWEPSTLKSNHARFIRRWRFNKNEVT